MCCLSVLENFFELKQYNIKSISDAFIKAGSDKKTVESPNEIKDTIIDKVASENDPDEQDTQTFDLKSKVESLQCSV